MPPQKEKLSQDGLGLKKLMESFSITFEGPVPPARWPPLYRHHFSVIRDIWSTRYDDYMDRTDINTQRKAKQQRRVVKIRENAYKLRGDLSINESTWRHQVEPNVVKIFEKRVICPLCGDEQHVPDKAAVPYNSVARKALETKRRSREQCDCEGLGKRFTDHDDEIQPVFKTVTEQVIMHSDTNEHDSYLKRIGVPMKPDRVIGLCTTPGMRDCVERSQWNLEHSPVKGTEMVYPFLVVEAKKERHAPGFRSIERQTAFPIRRLLHVQDELRNKASGSCHEPPLVWFFAYQGEEWRLYAGVFQSRTMFVSSSMDQKEKISVYDLWHGTVESEDGALQLLQIVDYIWAWARDILRPQVKVCLLGESGRSHSGSLDRGGLSSRMSNPRLDGSHRTETPDTIMTDIIETIEEMNPIISSNANSPRTVANNQGLHGTLPLSPTHQFIIDHPFSRWAAAHKSSEQFSTFSTIRHSNIIVYSFKIRVIHDIEEFIQRPVSAHESGQKPKLLGLLKSAILLQSKDVYELARHWTSRTPAVINTGNGNITVSLLYHTYCRPDDWQIVRQIQCIIWPKNLYQQRVAALDGEIVNKLRQQQPVGLNWLLSSFVQLRYPSGRHSLYAALKDYCLLPFASGQGVRWAPGTNCNIRPSVMKMCIELLSDNSQFEDPPVQVEGVSTVGTDAESTVMLYPTVGEVPDWQQAVVVVKPVWWPSDCPKFCLFVLLDDEFDDRDVLVKLLRDEFTRRRFYGPDSCSPSDVRHLREWLAWLQASSL